MSEQVVCKFNFLCDQKWDDLRIIENNLGARFCTTCESPVYLTESYEELFVNVAAKRCVAIRNFYPFDGDHFIGDVSLPLKDSLGIDPIFGRTVAELELSEAIEQKLRGAGIELIGDLVQFSGQSILFDQLLNDQEGRDLKEALAFRGLTIGMLVPNWVEYLERRKKKLG